MSRFRSWCPDFFNLSPVFRDNGLVNTSRNPLTHSKIQGSSSRTIIFVYNSYNKKYILRKQCITFLSVKWDEIIRNAQNHHKYPQNTERDGSQLTVHRASLHELQCNFRCYATSQKARLFCRRFCKNFFIIVKVKNENSDWTWC